MKILHKSLIITDPTSIHNGQLMDLVVENKKIVELGKDLNPVDAEVKTYPPHSYISPGFFDLHSHFGEPGLELSETLESGSQAAIAGGFTGVCLMPDTSPALDSRQGIEFIKNRASKLPLNIYPTGTVSAGRNGVDLAEMFDMQQGGAIAFTDHKRTISSAGLMQRALLYAKGINAIVMNFPETKELSEGSLMNEGIVSTQLGMKGNPAISEYLCVNRDLALARYLHTKIHLSCISTAQSVQLIREAKIQGIAVSCDVSAHHLFFTEVDLAEFDSNFKLKPSLREAADVAALIDGLIDGTIDAISTDHRPENIENKNLEFDYAAFGAIGLESFFGQVNKVLDGKLALDNIIDLIALNPRKILGLKSPKIELGADVEFTIFNPLETYIFQSTNIFSKSQNSPAIGRTLKGKVIGVLN
jgi:dihydroorotase